MIILRQKIFGIKYNPDTKKYEGEVSMKQRAAASALFGGLGAGFGGLIGGKKGALIGGGIGAGTGLLMTRPSVYRKHNEKIKAAITPEPEFNLSNINKYKNNPKLNWLPKEYWKLLEITLKVKPIDPYFDGINHEKYTSLQVKKPWNIEEVYDFDEKICHPGLISLGDNIHDSIGYYSDKNWYEGFNDYDGYYEGEHKIPNLKQYLIKAFQEDMKLRKDSEKILQYQEEVVKLIKQLL